MANQIHDVMTRNPETIDARNSIVEAATLMKKADAGMIPVLDGGRLIGTLTDRDIAIRVVAEGKDPETTSVHEVASTDLVTIEPDGDIADALRLMAEHQVRRLPVVENGGNLIGVLAQADVAVEGDDRRVGETVEKISS